LDNLRRSLDAPATLLWLLSAWLWLPGSPLVWTVATLLFSAGTLVSSVVGALLRGVGDGFLRSLRRQFQRWIIMWVFLPYEAIIAVHAITIVIRRLFFTHRHLLQWTTAARAQSIFGGSNPTLLAWQHMIGAPLIALVVGAAILWARPGTFLVALSFLIAWLLSPQLAVWLSRRGERPAAPLRPADVQEVQRRARV
jgi:cyclic beta-1,2-glucan synthetase